MSGPIASADVGMPDRVYAAFDVSQPVDQPGDLRGREPEVKALLGSVLHRRNHALISGHRGSGKTSLARVFGQHADREGVVVLYFACDHDTSFGELMGSYLEQIPPTMIDTNATEAFQERVADLKSNIGPHQAANLLSMIRYAQLVLIIDEVDRIVNPEMYDRIGSMLKLVSDARLRVRFVLVGGDTVFDDIVATHPSLTRHITKVATSPLSPDAIEDILERCASACGLDVDEASKRLIAEVACGSPYHARFFGMHAALHALTARSAEMHVEHVRRGLASAFAEWESLNPDDARIFREIVDEAHPLRGELIQLARMVAQQRTDGSSAPSRMVHRERSSRHAQAVAGTEGSIDTIGGQITFQDANAPQFLLALAHGRSGGMPQEKGHQRA